MHRLLDQAGVRTLGLFPLLADQHTLQRALLPTTMPLMVQVRKQLCPLTDLEFEVTRLLRAKVAAVSAEAGARLAPPSPKKIQHEGKVAYKCPECDKVCKRFPDYKKHFRTHGDNRPYPCRKPGCDKRFKEKQSVGIKRFHVETPNAETASTE